MEERMGVILEVKDKIQNGYKEAQINQKILKITEKKTEDMLTGREEENKGNMEERQSKTDVHVQYSRDCGERKPPENKYEELWVEKDT